MEYVTILESLKLNYAILKEQFLCKSKPYIDSRPDALDDLKNHYSSVINSARTASYINNLESLLRVLEKRNELSYDNIKPLIHIETRYVKSPELGTLLRNYEENMSDAPIVPLFNVYDALSGKYNVENENVSENTRHIWFASFNNIQHLYCTNHDEKKNQETGNVGGGQKIPSTETSSEENTSFNETHIFPCNNSSMSDNQCLNHGVSDSNIFNVKTQQRTSKYAAIVLLLIFLAATIFITLLISTFDPRPSEHSHQGQSRVQSNTRSSGFIVQSPRTPSTSTQPAFHVTLSAPVQISTQRSSSYEDPEIARIVFLEVSDNLGRHWRDVARFLSVTEHDIDEIDCQAQSPLKEKALKALTKFQSKSDPAQWKPKLQQALEKARRRDLMEMVEELWSRKYRST